MSEYNPISLFGKKPNYFTLNGKIYIKVNPSNLEKVIKNNKLIFIPEIFSYCVLISNSNFSSIIGEEKYTGCVIPTVVNDCPKLTILQFHYYITHCLSGVTHNLTYDKLTKFLMSKTVIKKVPKDHTHKKPQNRYKPEEYAIWAGIFEKTEDHDTPLIFPLGINRLLSSECFNFKYFCNSLLPSDKSIIII